jgi:hypothetical protein
MSLGGIFLIREPVLRGLLFAMGLFLISLSGVLFFTHASQADESRLVLLVPFLAGAILVALAASLPGVALPIALVLFLVVPAVLLLVLRIGCMVSSFSGGMCVAFT